MPVQPKTSTWLITTVALLGLAGCGDHGARSTLAPAASGIQSMTGDPSATRTILIPFDASNFQNGKQNKYFPLVPGTRYVYRQDTPDGVEIDTVEVTHDTKVIEGVTTFVVHDFVDINGSPKEDTFDWYAPDKDGNVWYFGEDTREVPTGDTTGSWEAGKSGAQAGIIMLAHPNVGDTYQQENSPGVVADMARVKDLNATAVVPYGTFTGCIKTQEWTPIEPGSRAFKLYAPNIGTVMEDENKKGGPVVLTSFATP